jgi:hypothetical protein
LSSEHRGVCSKEELKADFRKGFEAFAVEHGLTRNSAPVLEVTLVAKGHSLQL